MWVFLIYTCGFSGFVFKCSEMKAKSLPTPLPQLAPSRPGLGKAGPGSPHVPWPQCVSTCSSCLRHLALSAVSAWGSPMPLPLLPCLLLLWKVPLLLWLCSPILSHSEFRNCRGVARRPQFPSLIPHTPHLNHIYPDTPLGPKLESLQRH